MDLALQPNYGPSSVKAIAERQTIPAPYLEKLLMTLRRAGLVNAYRGVSGGYQLAQSPEKISLGQILAALEESVEPFPQPLWDQNQAEDWVTLSVWRQPIKNSLKPFTRLPWRIYIMMPAVGKLPRGKGLILSSNIGKEVKNGTI